MFFKFFLLFTLLIINSVNAYTVEELSEGVSDVLRNHRVDFEQHISFQPMVDDCVFVYPCNEFDNIFIKII
jgi:hypothetical protein